MSFDKDSWEMNVMVDIVVDKKGMVVSWSACEPKRIDLIRAGSPWVCLERHSGVLMGAAGRQLYCPGGRLANQLLTILCCSLNLYVDLQVAESMSTHEHARHQNTRCKQQPTTGDHQTEANLSSMSSPA